MNEPTHLSSDLVTDLRAACKSGKGNYGHRLLCGKAADELDEVRRNLAAALEREKVLAQRCKWYADSQEALRSRVCRQNDIDERGGM